MISKYLALATVLVLPLAGCGGGPSLIGPSSHRPSPSITSAAPPSSTPANGSFTWISIVGSRTLCSDITSQVGQSRPIWFSMRSEGSSVILSFSEAPPTLDPLADPPSIFKGTRSGNIIAASRTGSMSGLACPTDTSITPQVGGDLTATLSERQISGDYTEIFGTGAQQVTFGFHFQASLVSSLWGITYAYPSMPGDGSYSAYGGVNVEILDRSLAGAFVRSKEIDNGEYHFRDVPAGLIHVRASRPGELESLPPQPVEVFVAGSTRLDFVMRSL